MAACWKSLLVEKHVCCTPLFLLVMLSVTATSHSSIPASILQRDFRFTQTEYNATIREGSVGKVYATPVSKMGIYMANPVWDIRYKIMDGDNDRNGVRMFKPEDRTFGDFCFLMVRTRTGVNDVLNREVKSHYKLVIKAIVRNRKKPVISAQTVVNIYVEDANDLPPLFLKNQYDVTIPENTPLHNSITCVTAEDADIGVNGEVYYVIKEPTNKFAIHPTTGVVSLIQLLDYSEQNHFEFTVLAQDRGWRTRRSRAQLRILITEVNYYEPMIKIQELPIIIEQVSVGTIYAFAYVSDKDDGENGKISNVALSSRDPGVSHFVLEKDRREQLRYNIKVARPLDRESAPGGHNLVITAVDNGKPPKTATAVLHIKVGDSNDFAPQFDKPVYDFTIEECLPVKSQVGLVHAVDHDEGDNAKVTYSLDTTVEGSEQFEIDPETGLLLVAADLDIQTQSVLELRILAQDNANQGVRKSSTVPVKITLKDCNNHAPVFNQTETLIEIPENQSLHTEVYRVVAYDQDQGDNGFVSYSIVNEGNLPFEINPLSGVITTKQVLDYESMRRTYHLDIRASDWGKPFRREAETRIRVQLHDVNDNKPMFEKVDCVGYLSRESPLGTTVVVLSALDFDASNIISYHIMSGNRDGCFKMLRSTGEVKVNCSLKGHPSDFRSLVISASDGKNFAKSTVVNITLVSNSRSQQLANNDANINCRITDVAQQYSKLLQRSDENNREQDEDEKAWAKDFSENNHRPQFLNSSSLLIKVSEAVSVGSVIANLRATDGDHGFSGYLQYTILSGNKGSTFTIQTYSGNLKILQPLNREALAGYKLTVKAEDMGSPRKGIAMMLEVMVLDENDSPPVFVEPSYKVDLSEATPVNTSFLTVRATDQDLGVNSEIRYYMAGDEPDFSVNPFTGGLKVVRALDRENRDQYELKVRAVDGGISNTQSSIVSVSVNIKDVNDNPPLFVPERYHVRIREDLPVGAVVMIVTARDDDTGSGGVVRYSITAGGDGKFSIDRYTGVVRVVAPLDFEQRQIYNMTVRAKDRGQPSLSSRCPLVVEVVDVNENHHAPKFKDYVQKARVKESAKIGTRVIRLEARDEDRYIEGTSMQDYQIDYSIRDGNGLGIFSIDNEGNVETAALLDRESRHGYWLTVYAQDRGTVPKSSKMELYVEVEDVNDNIPRTHEPVYYPTVSENSAPGTSVVQLKADDLDNNPDERISYEISSGNPQGFFDIRKETGLIMTTRRRLDREKQEEHVLEVTVSDNGKPVLSSTTRVVVTVTDVNDNSPEFTSQSYRIDLMESGPIENPVAIFRVIAADKDSGPNADIDYSIESGEGDGRFKIHPKTGTIYSQREFRTDEEYALIVRAVDNGQPQRYTTAQVLFQIMSKPEFSPNPPVFVDKGQRIQMPENEGIGRLVTIIQATDIDKDRLLYSITGGDTEDVFTIHPNRPNILLAKSLDWETVKEYNLTVAVSDGFHVTHTWVHVTVLDINDNQPQFTQNKYEVEVYENTRPGTSILQVSATDADNNQRLFYTIFSYTDKASEGKFDINSETDSLGRWRGAITTRVTLNHEAMKKHEMTIMVRDQGTPSRRSLARVIVKVLDHNDHAPIFLSDEFKGRVFQSAPVGTSVVRVIATDKDTDVNAEVRYMILSGNVGDAFDMDEVQGIVSVAKPLDELGHMDFRLVVVARDGGKPPKISSTDVQITVTVPDNAPPRFLQDQYVVQIEENRPPAEIVASVFAISQSTIVYSITQGNDDGLFKINPNSGVIETTRLLDYEEKSLYNITVQASNAVLVSTHVVVMVCVIDVNDNSPVFEQELYLGSIQEGLSPGEAILDAHNKPLIVKATDADDNFNGMVMFTIKEVAARDVFVIDPTTGALRTRVQLDHEVAGAYSFSVTAVDRGQPQKAANSSATVQIKIIDMNDSPPRFTKSMYHAEVLLPTYKDIVLTQVNATDLDTEATEKLTYSITHRDDNGALTIAEDTGVITVHNPDLQQDRYELDVHVSDGRFSDDAQVIVSVLGTKHTGLSFTRTEYDGQVQENSTQQQHVAIVQASGQGLNEHITFSILNPGRLFKIGDTSGVISSTGSVFDREKHAHYTLVVEARDGRRPPRVAHALVNVAVTDQNDNAPVFVSLPYYALVSTSAKTGDIIIQVTAIDTDEGRNGTVEYSILNANISKERHLLDYLTINGKTGYMTLASPLEPELAGEKVNVTVQVTDQGMNPLSTQAVVHLTIIDSAMPQFDQPYYRVSLPEDIRTDQVVTTVRASSPATSKLVYSIQAGNIYGEFTVDFDIAMDRVFGPCTVKVKDTLDYEYRSSYDLTMRALDMVTGAHTDVTLHIQLQDVNDNKPTFKSEHYTVSVSEATPVGTAVLTVTADDEDTGHNAVVQYTIMSGGEPSDSLHFSVDPNSGEISVKQLLDHEHRPNMSFRVLATDQGNPPQSSAVDINIIVLDVSDNPPQFELPMFSCVVSDMAKPGQFVTLVTATDRDSADQEWLAYAIIDGNVGQTFHMNEKTGAVSVANLGDLILQPSYKLNISVTDGVFTTYAQLSIKTKGSNLHEPRFSQLVYDVDIAENKGDGVSITTVTATDDDYGVYGTVTYSIVGKDTEEFFSITEDEGELHLQKPLDREQQSQHLVRVKATDGGRKAGYATIRVNVADQGDNPPQFKVSEYKISLNASTEVNATVLQVQASDADLGANAAIKFSLMAGDNTKVLKIFDIDAYSGVISLRQSVANMENELFQFFVRAQDNGAPPQENNVPVSIYISSPADVPPKFEREQYSFSVLENHAVGSYIASLRAESQHQLNYKIIPGKLPENNNPAKFKMEQTGQISVTGELDRETVETYTLTVTAETKTSPPLVAHTVVSIQIGDVNDNHPELESDVYNVSIAENDQVGSLVLKIRAVDSDIGDNGRVTYSFAKPYVDMTSTFAVDPETGEITTLVRLDREKQDVYTFEVVAQDHGTDEQWSDRAQINIVVEDVNDEPPVFTSRLYQGAVNEDAETGTIITSVASTDADIGENAEVCYYITDGDSLGQFRVRRGGEIYINKNLDREATPRYKLTVSATDGAFVSNTTVIIDIMDANDNDPVCAQTLHQIPLSEDVNINTFVAQIKATDADEAGTPNSDIRYSLSGGGADMFKIHKTRGIISVAKSLDREKIPAFHMIAVAKDGGDKSCTTEVHVNLLDVNDNAPMFTHREYQVNIQEDVHVKSLIMRLSAHDPDLLHFGAVRYILQDDLGHFAIDPVSGIISLTSELDRETQDHYNVTVLAHDMDNPPKSSDVMVTVTVLDVNDNPPVFERAMYQTSVVENTGVGRNLLTVLAVSRDIGVNAQIGYSIVEGDEDDKFQIDAATGTLRLVGVLDYETTHQYVLNVEAKDKGTPPLTGHTFVQLNVTDVNDNRPVFTLPSYTARVKEDSVIGSSVIQAQATDRDSGLNAQLEYKIKSGDPYQHFQIDPTEGTVRIASEVDREQISSYTLDIQASDKGNPPQTSVVPVHVEVLDTNDNPPEFMQDNYTAMVQEGNNVGYRVIKVVVTDADLDPNGAPFTFDIVDGNENNKFRINSDGLIVTTATFNRQIKDSYNLTVRVYDAGSPTLHSDIIIHVVITEESANPPTLEPLSVSVNAFDQEFPGGVIGQVKGQDIDPQDQLHYTIVSDNTDLFTISEFDGILKATTSLDAGSYVINVSVSDGKFTVTNLVTLKVVDIEDDVIENSVVIRFQEIYPDDFVNKKMDNFKLALKRAITKADQVIIVSVQEVVRPAMTLTSRRKRSDLPDTEVLFAVQKKDETYMRGNAVRKRLMQKETDLENELKLNVVKVYNDVCEDTYCSHGICKTVVHFSKDLPFPIQTKDGSFVTSMFRLEAMCECSVGYGGPRCSEIVDQCSLNPCKLPKECRADGPSGYVCVCEPGLAGPQCDKPTPPECLDGSCPDSTAMTFTGRSYASWRFVDSTERRFSLSLHIKTFQHTARLMHAVGNVDYSILEIVSGFVQYRFDCGSGEGLVHANHIYINDGEWHSILVERQGKQAEILIDGRDPVKSSAPDGSALMNLGSNHVFFGAEVTNRGSGDTDTRLGFEGCMKDIKVANTKLPLSGSNKVAILQRLKNIAFFCKDVLPNGLCSSKPCKNGGTCLTQGDNQYFCKCSLPFTGPQCQDIIGPCLPNPCLNNGKCEEQGRSFTCQCPGFFSGERCQHRYVCQPNPCHNRGICKMDKNKPVCSCIDGYTGEHCEQTVNGCVPNPCQYQGTCINREGSVRCICTPGHTGRLCSETSVPHITSSSLNITIPEIIGIAGGVLCLFLIALAVALLVRFCRRRHRKKAAGKHNHYIRGDLEANPKVKMDGTYQAANSVPPPVPEKPALYRRSTDSSNPALNNFDFGRHHSTGEDVDMNGHQQFPNFRPINSMSSPGRVRALPPPPLEETDPLTKAHWDANNPNFAQNHPDYKAPNKSLGPYGDVLDDDELQEGSVTHSEALHWDNYDLGLQHETPVPNIRGVPAGHIQGIPLMSHPSEDSLINNQLVNPDEYDPDTNAEDSDFVDSEYIGDSECGDQEDLDEFDDPVSDYPDPPDYNDVLAMQGNAGFSGDYSLPRPQKRSYNLHPNVYLPQYSVENSQNDLDQFSHPHMGGDSEDRDSPPQHSFPKPGNYAKDYEPASQALDNMSMSMDGQTSTNASVSDISETEASRLCEIEDSEANLSGGESGDENTPLAHSAKAKISHSHTHTDV